jgi:hypothetical protein
MESVFLNGGFIGKTFDFGDTSRYVIVDAELATLQYVGGRAAGTTGTTSNLSFGLTTLTGGTNSSPQAGDLVIVSFATNSADTGLISYRISGYTQIANIQSVDTERAQLQVGYKIMGSTPDTTVVITGGTGDVDQAAAVAVQVWRNVDPTTPFDVTRTISTSINTVDPNPPSITPVTSGAVIVAAGGGGHATSGTFTSGDLTNFVTANGSDVHDVTVGMGSYTWTSGPFDPVLWGFTGTDSTNYAAAAVTMALRPATITVPILGNQKNSGIWSLSSVNEYFSSDISGINFLRFEADGVSAVSKTYSNIDFGVPNIHRNIVVVVSVVNFASTPTVSINGITATGINSVVGTSRGIWSFIAPVPSGTTGEVVVTFPDTEIQSAAIYSVYTKNSTPFATDSKNNVTLSLSVPKDGLYLSASQTANDPTGLSGPGTLNYDADINTDDFTTGYSGSSSVETTATWTGIGAMIAISWSP